MLIRDHSAFSTRLPVRPGLRLAMLLAAFAFGCTPKIGDSCTTSTNCSASGDRLCDITQPGGYCTVFNCEPGSCPDNSVCINFGTSLSAANGCSPSNGNSPYQRSFCLAACSNDGDCRGGYECADLNSTRDPDHAFARSVGAVVADSSGSGSSVCVPAYKDPKKATTPVPPNTPGGVCTGDPDAGTPLSDNGNGGSSGSSSNGGAGGDSGAAGAPSANEAGAGG